MAWTSIFSFCWLLGVQLILLRRTLAKKIYCVYARWKSGDSSLSFVKNHLSKNDLASLYHILDSTSRNPPQLDSLRLGRFVSYTEDEFEQALIRHRQLQPNVYSTIRAQKAFEQELEATTSTAGPDSIPQTGLSRIPRSPPSSNRAGRREEESPSRASTSPLSTAVTQSTDEEVERLRLQEKH
ncbi:hypothetical protein BJ508DRAFT_309136 [Ascobolus immersus RN42]|uniref:Uncharacterized protein n=1 Tax=Ascobolus immersus RN42 TaxID=1160509 RepID=A0A3N4I1U1_ASCIM|nr:hypothetical protein BJ508DRAFT_309136 [Ascobolus immersus RN42]